MKKLLLIFLLIPVCAFAGLNTDSYQETLYQRAISKLNSANNEYSRWVALDAAAKQSVFMGKDEDAKTFATELERLAPKYAKDWNYGNAIQDYNMVFGMLALKTGDINTAKTRLLAAGGSPGSAQMDSFGPNMTLARDLLLKGEKSVVLDYLELCRKFWAQAPNMEPVHKMNNDTINQWKKEIEDGKIPDFGANLDY